MGCTVGEPGSEVTSSSVQLFCTAAYNSSSFIVSLLPTRNIGDHLAMQESRLTVSQTTRFISSHTVTKSQGRQPKSEFIWQLNSSKVLPVSLSFSYSSLAIKWHLSNPPSTFVSKAGTRAYAAFMFFLPVVLSLFIENASYH